jgi:hypothetical protein
MARPLVTIVTPSYNQGPFIRSTIESVLSQDYEAVEYIIMDGGSTDETAAIVSEYASRLTWISERDRGQSHAINKGFRMARGEIVAWLNSDDLFLPGAISRAVAELTALPHLAAVYGEGYLIDRDGNITERFPITEPFNLWKLVHLSDYILQQTVFFRKNVFEEVGCLDEDLHYVMDWDLLIRIGKRYEIGYISALMGCLREYAETKTFAGGAPRVAEIRELMRRHNGMRWAPGYIVYGLDTYRKIWVQAIGRHTPALLSGPSKVVQWLVDRACSRIIGGQILKSQGWSADGWADRRVKLMAPASASAIILRGTIPNGDSRLLLEARSNGCVVQKAQVGPGRFTVRVPLATGGQEPRIIEVVAPELGRKRRRYVLGQIELEMNPVLGLKRHATAVGGGAGVLGRPSYNSGSF